MTHPWEIQIPQYLQRELPQFLIPIVLWLSEVYQEVQVLELIQREQVVDLGSHQLWVLGGECVQDLGDTSEDHSEGVLVSVWGRGLLVGTEFLGLFIETILDEQVSGFFQGFHELEEEV